MVVHSLFSIIGGALGGLATSLFLAVLVEPKKERIRNYNSSIKELDDLLDKFHDLVIEYWTGLSRSQSLELKITAVRTKIHDKCCSLTNNCSTRFPNRDISKDLRSYFVKVTGGNFQSNKFSSNPLIVHEGQEILTEVKQRLIDSYLTMTLRHIILTNVK